MKVEWREIEKGGGTVAIFATIMVEQSNVSHDHSFITLTVFGLTWQFRMFYLEGQSNLIRVTLTLLDTLMELGAVLTSLKMKGGSERFFRFHSGQYHHTLGYLNLHQYSQVVPLMTFSVQFEFQVIASAALMSHLSFLEPSACVAFIFPFARAKMIGMMSNQLVIHSDVLFSMLLENPRRADFYVYHLKFEAVKVAFFIICGRAIKIKVGMLNPLMNVYRSWRIEAVLTAVSKSIDNYPISLCEKLRLVEKWKIDVLMEILFNHIQMCPLCCLLVRNDNKFGYLSESLRESIIAALTDHLNNWNTYGQKMKRIPGICPRCETDEADILDAFCAYSPLEEEEEID